MSIDTYDTMAIIRPGVSAPYNLDWIEGLAREVAGTSGAAVARKPAYPDGEYISLTKNGVELHIYYSDEPWVAGECEEIADDCDGRCRGSTRLSRSASPISNSCWWTTTRQSASACGRRVILYSTPRRTGLLFEDDKA